MGEDHGVQRPYIIGRSHDRQSHTIRVNGTPTRIKSENRYPPAFITNRFVLYAIGVAKLILAPNRTANTNGSAGNDKCWEMPTAMGVPITAAALLETIFVIIAITNIMTLINIVGEASPTMAKNTCAKYSAPPVFNKAVPRARLATTIIITCELSA